MIISLWIQFFDKKYSKHGLVRSHDHFTRLPSKRVSVQQVAQDQTSLMHKTRRPWIDVEKSVSFHIMSVCVWLWEPLTKPRSIYLSFLPSFQPPPPLSPCISSVFLQIDCRRLSVPFSVLAGSEQEEREKNGKAVSSRRRPRNFSSQLWVDVANVEVLRGHEDTLGLNLCWLHTCRWGTIKMTS